jgi:hypothetical protein
MTTTPGIHWKKGPFGHKPHWTDTPDVQVIEKITRKSLGLGPVNVCSVVFLAQGDFNKVYKVTTAVGVYIFRVALPLDPLKVSSEVATIEWVRANVNITSVNHIPHGSSSLV